MSIDETKVKIKLNSTIVPTDGEEETYEMWLDGSLIKKTGKMYLRYEEQQSEGTINTTVKMDNHQALILRSGGVKMRLPFDRMQEQQGHYETHFGTMPIVTKTHHLSHENGDESKVNGTFKIQYDLLVSDQAVGKYTLEIQYVEGQK
ncbi:DUF1934 domain-containing protein [Lysinibacillus yapensis]|uniref:DUF1934 domain-containing protein n=1 Tax=Ureibacillus yapensis TaxID=2304605 RepID=A0A396SG69_9BACL|nr:DUF1934 domain-containing protein [Lysinibacillus yapensis]RHW40042.1 DUF1934 domain-containing protein [Lysinibacillus yapensis]